MIEREQKKYIGFIENGNRLNIQQWKISSETSKEIFMAKKRLYTLNENVFENIDNEDKAYWLGFIAADGCVCVNKENKYTLTIALKSSDYIHLERFNKFIETNRPLGFYKNEVRITINSKKIVNDLINLGCVPRKGHILEWISLSKDLERHFIRGLIDGDGSFYLYKDKSSKVRLGFNYTGTLSMVTNFKNTVSFLKCGSIISDKRTATSYMFNSLQKLSNCKLLFNYLYKDATIYLERKYNKISEIISMMDVQRL